MSVAILKCPKCRTPLPEAFFNAGRFAPCPSCRRAVQCETFPALHAGPRLGRPGDPLVDASEASCFFHAEKRAAVACDSCGRLICSLCDLDMGGRHICPQCFSSGRKKGALRDLDHYRTSWASIALLIAVLPLLVFSFVVPFTAVAALVVAFIGLRKPGSITGQRRILTFVLAIGLAVAELGGSIFFGKKLFDDLTTHATGADE